MFVIAFSVILLAGCHHGPERLKIEVENAVLKPGTTTFAVATHVWTVRDPQGFVATFPNGGVLDVRAKTAKIFVVDIQADTIELLAEFDETTVIPNPKKLRVIGWLGDDLYFHMEGYGGYKWSRGDDTDDPREAFFRVLPNGQMHQIQAPPTALKPVHQYYALREPTYISVSSMFEYLKIHVDGTFDAPKHTAYFVIDPGTGKPSISQTPPKPMYDQSGLRVYPPLE